MVRSLVISGVAFTVSLLSGCARGEDLARVVVEPEPTGFLDDGGTIGPRGSPGGAPLETCEDAVAEKAYVGCEFWPTVVANNVWSTFDYAVIVANAGTLPATVTVTGNGVSREVTVDPGALSKIYLPWQKDLKGPDADSCGDAHRLMGSVRVTSGAYHLVSSRPVSVYQFNALEYDGHGGPPGKDWGLCPGHLVCASTDTAVGCLSFSNDASLLLPVSALTGNYRVAGIHGWSHPDPDGGPDIHVMGSYFTITATANGTHVKVKTGTHGAILAGGGVPATPAGGMLTLTMNAGDVAELVGPPDAASDPSGGLVTADKPVQVIAGAPCLPMPIGKDACDHLEESVFPAETWGTDYFVTVPTSPNGEAIGHVVRLYGNVDATHLTWAPEKPAGAPTTINAGDVIEVPGIVREDLRVTGTAAFAVATFSLSSELVDSNGHGDPSMSMTPSLEQFRRNYVFLAPDDYDVSYIDVVEPVGTAVLLDNEELKPGTPIGKTGFAVVRAKLSQNGTHTLVATEPVSLQVMGYGAYTSYQYPGGLDLKAITPPPVR